MSEEGSRERGNAKQKVVMAKGPPVLDSSFPVFVMEALS